MVHRPTVSKEWLKLKMEGIVFSKNQGKQRVDGWMTPYLTRSNEIDQYIIYNTSGFVLILPIYTSWVVDLVEIEQLPCEEGV